jgi:TM2 domain-containing membrane protein YozV
VLHWPARRITTIALVLWLVAGILKMVVGLVPENTIAGLHLLGAANLPILSLAITMLGVAIHQRQHGLALFSILIGVVGIVGAILSTASQTTSALNLGLGNGGMERVAGYPGNIWMVVVGIAVLYAASQSTLQLPLPDATEGLGANPAPLPSV